MRNFNIAGKIAIVCHSHPSVSRGGAEIAAYTLFRGLLDLGTDAIFIAACPEEGRNKLSLSSVREHVIFYNHNIYDNFYHLSNPEIAKELASLLGTEQVKLANFHHFFNLGVSGFRRLARETLVKSVLTLHEFLAICHHHGQMITRPAFNLCEQASPSACSTCFPEITRQQFALRKQFLIDTLRSCDGYVSPSAFLAHRFTDWGLDERRMIVIENGLSFVPARPASVSRDRPRARWVFGYFGQINPFKGVDVILRAVELLARDEGFRDRVEIRVHGNLIGVGEEFTSRFLRAVEGDAPISWLGPYDNANVGRLMSQCDYVIVPSRWWENSPVVIQEAFAVGRPVICTGIGGMAEKVADGESGLHFRVNDHVDLLARLREAADEDTYAKLREALPIPFGHEEMARRYLTFFEAICGDGVVRNVLGGVGNV